MTAGSTDLPALPNCHGSGTTYFSSVYRSATKKGANWKKIT